MALALLERRTVLAGALALGACAPKPKASAKLADVTLRGASYRGNPDSFFHEAGVGDPPYHFTQAQFASGTLIAQAINARALDVGGMSEIPPVFVVGAPGNLVRIVAVLRGDVNNQVVLVPPASRLKTIGDLRGKRIGYVRATTSHFILLKLLGETGLAWGDITPVALSPQDGLAAFQRGSLIADPGRRAAIADYLQRYRKVLAWINADDARYAGLLQTATAIPAEYYLQQFAQRSARSVLEPVSDAAIASQQGVADVFFKAGVIPAKVDVRPLWDAGFSSVLNGSA
jgi:sulfonate transport system substrate-binding protein